MEKCKRAMSIVLAFVMLFTYLPLTARAEEGNQIAPQAAVGTVNRSDLIYGTNGTITRAEWLHNLAVLFEMKVEEENLPDNYFSDITQQDAYYRDILLTVEFGVIAIEAGGKVLPNEPVTREFAAHTLNYCLGYKLDEGESCTLKDAAKLEYPEDDQIAVNRGWLQAVSQEFRPQEKLQEAEMRRMFEDASAALQSTEISNQYKNTYQFAEGVIELPPDTNYDMDENGFITIYGSPKEIRKGDAFAIYINGLPSVYQAKNVTTSGGAIQIETTGTEQDGMLKQADAQGNAESDLGLAEAAEGADVTYIVGGTEEASFEDGKMYKSAKLAGNKKIKAIKASKTLKLGKGMKVQFNCTLSDVSVDYKIKTLTANKEVYVSAKGTMEANCNVSVDALQAAGIPSSFDLVYIPVGGVGSITVSMEYAFSGKLSLTYKAGFSEGVQYTSGGGFREVHKFEKKNFTIASEAEVSAGVKASLSITAIPLVKGKVAARIGAKTHFSSDTYNDGKAPKICIDISSYLYASAEASLSLAFVDKNLWKENITIFDQKNSPIRVVYHYEDNRCVPVCTRNPGKYYTSYSSKYGSSGFGYGDSSGTDKDGNVVAIYTYSLDEDENATITKFMGNASALMIPSELDGYTVVAIGDKAFQGNKNIRSVIIPDTVKKIGASAFGDCTNLGNVILSSNLEEMGSQAFARCELLTEIEIPKSLTICHVGADGYEGDSDGAYTGPFYECSGLEIIRFENGTKQITKRLFAGCTGLKEISIPNIVTVIGEKAFEGCTNLKEIEIPDSVTEIEWCAFSRCRKMETAIIGDGVTQISADAFANCGKLSNVRLSKNLVEMGAKAFARCESLKEIEIPKSLTTCHVGADGYEGDSDGAYTGPFYECSGLEVVRFESGTKQIAKRLFAGCTGLKEISIPNIVTVIGEKAFEGCTNLKEIEIPDSVTEIEWCAFSRCRNMETAIIGDSVTQISADAFANCGKLSNVRLSKNLVEMGAKAFARCESLKEIEIPKSLATCHVGADGYEGDSDGAYTGPFYECSGLEVVRFESGTKQIAKRLFAGCTGLKEISIPNIVTVIGEKAFEGCTNLKEMEIPDSVTKIEWCAFSRCRNMETAAIKNGVKQMDANAFAGCKNLSKVTLSENCDTIENSVFKDCSSLTSIKIPSSVKYVRASAFENSGLKEIMLPESVELIENAAFKNSTLEKAVLSDNITRIGREAFASCAALTQVSLGKKVEEIGNNAFANCDVLPGISLPDSVKTIGTHIFEGCDVLMDVKLGTGLTTIPSYAFHECVKLLKIELPYRITTIKDHAFTNCVKLKSITVPRAAASIDEAAFSYPDSMTMYGVSGTYAETYAKKMGMTFVNQQKKAVKVTLNQTELALARGAQGRLQIRVDPADFTDEVAWKSAAPSVAEVSSDGVVTAKGIGNTTIKVTVGDCSASCSVKVVQPVTGINLDKRELEMEAGSSYLLTARVRPDNANNQEISWMSSEPKVASVDENGNVSALAKGTAVITAAAKDGSNVKATCNVTVKNNRFPVTDINGLESSHNYENNCTDFWVYTKPGAASLKVTFDEKTELEDGFDYLYIYDGSGGQIGKYTGAQLAGEEVLIAGDTVKIQLATDDGGTAWGFKVSDIVEGSAGEKEKQILSGTDSYEKSYQDEPFLLDIKIEKGNGTLSYRSLDEKVVEVDGSGLVSIKGIGTTSIEVSASATDLYESARMRIAIVITDSGSGGEPEGDIAAAEIEIPDLIYNGKEQRVKPTVLFKGKPLNEGTDYLLSGDESAAEIGTYTVTIKGIGAYKGSVVRDYKVFCRHQYDNGKVTRDATCKQEGERTYTCQICQDKETETIPKTTHNYGTERVTAKASVSKNGTLARICSICGDKKSSVIYAAKSIKLSSASYQYDGKAKKPSVTIRDSKGNKLKNGTDYKVNFAKGRKNVGSYAVTIQFLGKYGGTARKAFAINPGPTSLAKVTPKAKGMAVSWKKQKKQIGGYEIAYSTSSRFAKKATRTITVSKGKTTKTIVRLKGKKRYYVKIRTYMPVKGKEYYSAWSKVKSVVTKK